MKWWRIFPALLLALALAGCKSAHVNAVVENQTGQAVNLVEVDYPSASFGVDSLANGSTYSYLVQIRLSGKISVQYTESQNLKVHKVTGPELHEGQRGQITIILQPNGKVRFEPQLKE